MFSKLSLFLQLLPLFGGITDVTSISYGRVNIVNKHHLSLAETNKPVGATKASHSKGKSSDHPKITGQHNLDTAAVSKKPTSKKCLHNLCGEYNVTYNGKALALRVTSSIFFTLCISALVILTLGAFTGVFVELMHKNGSTAFQDSDLTGYSTAIDCIVGKENPLRKYIPGTDKCMGWMLETDYQANIKPLVNKDPGQIGEFHSWTLVVLSLLVVAVLYCVFCCMPITFCPNLFIREGK